MDYLIPLAIVIAGWALGAYQENRKKNAGKAQAKAAAPKGAGSALTPPPAPQSAAPRAAVEYQPLFEEGTTAIDPAAYGGGEPEEGARASAELSDAELEAHWERWRRAVVDSEILRRPEY